MAVQITDENLGEYMSALGANLEQTESIEEVSQIDDNTVLPGVKVENEQMTGYIRMKMLVLKNYLEGVKTAIQTQWTAWFGNENDNNSGVKKIWTDWFTGRQSEWDVLKTDSQSATSAANTAATRANTAAGGAENVNAQLSGLTVTITDRNGIQRTVDLSFDFYDSYPSVAAMQADAANIPVSKLVSIATTDKTSEENARIYQKRSDGVMIYVADLDQASAEAWADWLNNMKPEINERIATADSDHTRAVSDHSTASTDHSTAQGDHSQAGTDHSTASSDHTRAESDHTIAEQDHVKATNDHSTSVNDHNNYQHVITEAENVNAVLNGTELTVTDRYGAKTTKDVKGPKGDDIDYSTMTSDEKQELADTVVQHVVSENILGPEYDEEGEGIVFPTSMKIGYEDEGIIFG